MLSPEMTELSEGVIPALIGIERAQTVGEARRAASLAYIDNTAPDLGQDMVQGAIKRAKQRLSIPTSSRWQIDMSW